MPLSVTPLNLDIVIIGGGIAGLWLANRLNSEGYSCVLLEHKALGSDQTIASQGMIHGGMKYTLNGALTGASEAVADMPQHWRACLCGEGDVDLRNTRILSDHFYLWSGDSLTSKIASFLASKATHARADKVPDDKRPPLLRHTEFNGSLYKLVDLVLDVPSLVTNLEHNIKGKTLLIDWSKAQLHKNDQGTVSLTIKSGDGNTQEADYIGLHAQRFIFCAGQGNAQLLAQLGLDRPAMQLRPLQQVMVKHTHPYVFFGHCMGAETTPRLTISTHRLSQHEHVWYLGGSLAERGAKMNADSLIVAAQQELSELLPWVDLSQAEWATLPLNRAEPLQPNFIRPDNAFVNRAKDCNNILVAWPTKLTLVPNLANQVLEMFRHDLLTPGDAVISTMGLTQLRKFLPAPPLAATPWALAFPPAISAEDRLNTLFVVPPPRKHE